MHNCEIVSNLCQRHSWYGSSLQKSQSDRNTPRSGDGEFVVHNPVQVPHRTIPDRPSDKYEVDEAQDEKVECVLKRHLHPFFPLQVLTADLGLFVDFKQAVSTEDRTCCSPSRSGKSRDDRVGVAVVVVAHAESSQCRCPRFLRASSAGFAVW
jgi:hypothetical protein